MVVMQLGLQQNFGAAGSYFGAHTALQNTAAGNTTLPRGLWQVTCSANDIVQYTPDSGATYYTLLPSLTGGLVFSDGFNVRIHNTGVADSGAVFSYYAQVLAVPGV